MRKKIAISSLVCILSLSGTGYANDDVYVDLSVLDAMPQDSIGFVETQPVFPMIPKISGTTEKSIGVKVKLVKPEPRKPEMPKTLEDENLEKETPILEIPAPMVEMEKNNISETEQKQSVEEKQMPLDTENALLITPVENKATQSILSAKLPENTSQNDAEKIFEPREIYSLSFTSDSSELSEETLQRLKQITERLAQEREKKISIKAYNYDNGQDSFRKKRISLNRATEVRSYFLSEGFRNFSIKIINTTTDNEYKDTVEIEALN